MTILPGARLSAVARAQFTAETDVRGAFVRQPSRFRDRVTADGSSGFRAEPGRYHLYVSLACPWAHRTIIFRALKRLERRRLACRWSTRSATSTAGRSARGRAAGADPVNGFAFLSRGLPARPSPATPGRVHGAGALGPRHRHASSTTSPPRSSGCWTPSSTRSPDAKRRLLPARAARRRSTRSDLRVYRRVNNGVYRGRLRPIAGRRTTRPFTAAVRRARLAGGAPGAPALPGGRPHHRGRLAPVHDAACASTRCTTATSSATCAASSTIPNLWGFTRDLYQRPGVAETVDMDHIKRHYYVTHDRINPSRIVPVGPDRLRGASRSGPEAWLRARFPGSTTPGSTPAR